MDHDWIRYGGTTSDLGMEIPWWKCKTCRMVVKEMFEKPTREDLEIRGWPATCEEFQVAEVMSS